MRFENLRHSERLWVKKRGEKEKRETEISVKSKQRRYRRALVSPLRTPRELNSEKCGKTGNQGISEDRQMLSRYWYTATAAIIVSPVERQRVPVSRITIFFSLRRDEH